MSKKPIGEDSSQRTASKRVVQKRQLSKWEKEGIRRRIIEIVIAVVIVGVVISGGIVAYFHLVKPWHQPILTVNGKTYDMDYFVKMLRLWGAGDDTSQDIQTAYSVVDTIRDNELIRQKAEELEGLGVLGVIPTDDDIEEEFRNQIGYDPENPENGTLDELYKQAEEWLKENYGISVEDYKQLYIGPMLIRRNVEEAMGYEEYPADSLYEHVKVQAILLGTKEDAIKAKEEWSKGIEELVDEYSSKHYYPKDSVEWLPRDIEGSTVFENYAFSDGVEGEISDPIQDTTYSTGGGYWLVMVYEPEEEEEHEEEGLYIKAILLDSEEEAIEVAGEYDGENFADLAEENSLHSTSKGNGGDMGWLSLEDIDSQFGAGVLATINDLSQDEISTPIENTDGYWLVMVTEGDGEGEEGELYINAILLATEDEAEEVAAKFEDGDDFATLAKDYSLDSSADDGGDMGWMSQEDIELKFGAGVLAIINNLSQDEVSTPLYDEDVNKQSGYWVIQVLYREDRPLIDEHREVWASNLFNDWIVEARDSEENVIVNYLDDEDNGYEKILWALDHL